MSDKRAVLTITSSVVAIAMVIGMITGIAASSDFSTQTTTTPMGIMGHVTFTITDSDGNIKSYFQSDNVNTDTVSDCIAVDLFAPTVTADPGCGIMSNMGIGFNISVASDDNTALALETVSTRTTCTPAGVQAVGQAGGSSSQVICAAAAHTITAGDIAAAVAFETGNVNLAATLTVDRGATPGQLVDCADLIPAIGDGVSDSCEISEIGLFDQLALGGNMYGRITIATLTPGSNAQFVKVGDTVTATYQTNIG